MKNVNELIVKQNEIYKTEIADLKNTLKPLLEISLKFQKLYDFTHKQVTQNSGDILMNTEGIKSLKKQIGDRSSKIISASQHDKLVTRVNNIEQLQKCNTVPDQDTSSDKVNFLTEKVNKLNIINDGFLEDLKVLKNELYYLKGRVEKKSAKVVNNTSLETASKSTMEDSTVEIDCDILLLFDSNGKFLKPEKFHREGETQYLRVVKTGDTIERIRKAQINKSPSKILLNVGLNDVGEMKAEDIINNYRELLALIHAKMPDAIIYLSSIFKRKDGEHVNDIIKINDDMNKFSEITKWFNFVYHSNINISMMYDTKHLNKAGFYTILTNLKYVMFKILPNFRKHSGYTHYCEGKTV